MAYKLVIDPETKEERYEWVDKTESSAGQKLQEIKEADKNFSYKDAAIGTAKAIPRMVLNSGINAVQEGSDTIRDIGGYFGIGEGTTSEEPDKPILGMGDWKPEPLESSGVAEDIGTGILQFGLEWLLLSKALKGINWGLKGLAQVPKVGKLIQPVTKLGTKAKKIEAGIVQGVGKPLAKYPLAQRTAQDITKFGIKTATATSPKAALIDFAGFDQYEGRLYDLAANSDTWFNNVKHIPLLNQLATNPEDEGLKGRFKNALEGGFIDFGLGGAISTASAVKVINARIKLGTLLSTPKNSPSFPRLQKEAIEAAEKLENIPEIKKRLSEQEIESRIDRAAFDKARADLPPAERDKVWKQIQERNRNLIVDKQTDNVQITNREKSIAEAIKRGDLPLDDEVLQMVQDGNSYDQIIEKVTSRKPKPFTPIDEDPRGISRSRGAEKIKKRIMKKFPSDGIDIEEAEGIEEFIDIIGGRMFDDVGISIKGSLNPGKDGEYNFLTNLVSIRKKIIEEGKLERTVIHELWHSLSRYLPKADLARYKKEFLREQKKYLQRWEQKKKAWIKETTPEDLQMRLQIDSWETGFGMGKKITEKNFADEAAKYFDRNKFKGEADYRYTDLDEYFAENMTDAFFSKLDEGLNLDYKGITKGNQFIQTDNFRSLIYKIGIYFRDLIASVHARLGGPQTKKIFNDFLQQRNTVLERDHPLGWSDDAISAFERTKEGVEREMAVKTRTGEIIPENQLKSEDFVVGKKSDADDPRGSYDEEARKYDEEQARLSEEPAGGKRSKEEVEGLSEDVIEAFRKIESGEADLLDTPAAWQDITTLRSPKGKEYYPGSSAEGGDFETILDAITHRFDKIMDTGMWSVSPKRIAQELGAVFKEQGMNLDAILYDEKLIDATEIFANNVENVTNLLKIRFGLNFAGEQSAKWAHLVYQATDNPSINKAEAISEMMRSLETTLQFSRVYQTWTRSAGQLLNAAQAEIITDGLTEATKRTNLNFDKVAAISEASQVPATTIVSNLPDEILTAMKTGEWTPETEGFFDQLVMYAMNTKTPEGIKTLQDYIGADIKAKGMRSAPKISNYEKWSKGLGVYYVNNLLSAAGTWAVQFSGAGRAGVEPALMSLNALAHGDFRHAKIALMQYDYLRRSFYGSLKLGAKAFELGQSLYDPKIRTAAFASDLADDSLTNINAGYAKDRAYQLSDPHPSYDLNTSPFTTEAKGNPGLNIANVLWRLGTWNIRGQLALDTFTKSIAGNSLAFVTGIDQGLEKGRRLGLEGITLQNYARKYAEGRIEFYTFDAIVNGETIADALMKDEAAIQIGRILTFTDETRARMPGRNYQYGEELAKARGMTDEKEIAEFAELYQEGGNLKGLEQRYNNFTQGNVLNQAKNNKSLPDPGDITPVITSAWSQIPMRWGRLQASKHGFWASIIQPFNRSPGDITKQWLRHTPFAMSVDTFYRDLFNENYFLRNRWKTEQATGLAAAGFFVTTVFNDEEFPIEFTGFGPNDPGMRKEWTDNERPPLSWRWRGRDANGLPTYGKWHSYRGFEPAATLIGGLADYKMLYADLSQEQRDDLIAGFSMSITAQVMLGRFSATYYKGIVEFIDAIGLFRGNLPGRREMEPSERTKLERYVQRLLSNFIPESSRLRELSRAIDPYKREIDSGVKPIEAFEEVDKNLVTMEDNQGNIIYLKPQDISGEQGKGDQLMEYIGSFFRQQLDEIKNNTPGFSKTLPPRINWITGLPIRNKGFLGSDQLPMDDAPWLSQLSSAYFGTIKGAISNFGIGATGHTFDPRLETQKQKGTETYEYKAAIVNDELIKLNRAGDLFEPPRPTDFMIKGVRLSPPAFRQYKEYIYSLPHPKYGGLTLTEALYQRITSKDYQAQEYTVHPTNGADPLEGFVRSDEIQEIINDYKHNAKEEFRTSPNNPYRMEIQIPEQRIKAAEEEQEFIRRNRTSYLQGDNIDLNAKQFADKLNQ